MRLTAEPKPRPTCPCRWCGKPTTYLGTRECDPCHGASRVEPALLRRIADGIEFGQSGADSDRYQPRKCPTCGNDV